jgi:integrase
MDSRLADLASAYLRAQRVRRKNSASHVARIKGCLEGVLAALSRRGTVTARELSPAAFHRARDERAAQVSAATVNKEFGSLLDMLRSAEEDGTLPTNPLRGIRQLPTEDKRVRRALRDEEIHKLLAVARAEDETLGADRPRIPQAPLWLSILWTGARFAEITSATWADFDPEARTLTLKAATTKNRRHAVLPLVPELVAELGRLRAAQGAVLGRVPTGAERVMLSPEGAPWSAETRHNALARLRRHLRTAGIKSPDSEGRRVDIHALRVTFGTRLARAGVPLMRAVELMRHSDPRLTQRVYVDLGLDDASSELERLSSLAPNAGAKVAPREDAQNDSHAEAS